MSGAMSSDPEMDLAELCLDAADRAEARFERLSQRADEAPTPKLREILAMAAAQEMVFIHPTGFAYQYDRIILERILDGLKQLPV